MIERIDKITGRPQSIATSGGGSHYFVLVNHLTNTPFCGIWIDEDYYVFKHENIIYRAKRPYKTDVLYKLIEKLNFEDDVITLFKLYGNWYDAFIGVIL